MSSVLIVQSMSVSSVDVVVVGGCRSSNRDAGHERLNSKDEVQVQLRSLLVRVGYGSLFEMAADSYTCIQLSVEL